MGHHIRCVRSNVHEFSTHDGASRSELDEIASNFDDEALENINDCWQDKLKDLEDALEYYEETNATWETNQGQSSINPDRGAQTQFEVDPAKVVFYPNQIVKWIKKNSLPKNTRLAKILNLNIYQCW